MADTESENTSLDTVVEGQVGVDATKIDQPVATEVVVPGLTLADVKASPEDIDADGFVSLWNIASNACNKNTIETRELAARLLCFLCRKQCDFVVTSGNNAEYLDQWFERDNKLLYDWKPESETVDVVAQHAEVPHDAFVSFLDNNKFDPAGKYAATRAVRVQWFQEMWCVG
ncbi:hypothetical protein Pla52o_09360 [Novipirellula galeiformis]|uniref:Uncharacterized protein n=1 Tax=Novipirellula galeiformis TaxID=2528004 RepID=A0A5C6CU96_9BACT|nr:hypothetical protein [Novipirellula galeiformis]TWU27077.1 hypothetical protein Pla52o_09360 [Novipirellula galeiformis]